MSKLKIGTLVVVSYPPGERWHNPAHKYDGEQMVIKSVRYYPNYSGSCRKMFTLYGAESDAGKPYWFLEDELITL